MDRAPSLIGAVLFVAVCGWLASRLGSEFIPNLDEGDLAVQALRIPGTSLTQSLEMQFQVERALADVPEVKTYFARVGTAEVATDPMPPNISDGYVMLKDRKDWPDPDKSKAALVEEIEKRLEAVPGNAYEISQPIQLRFNELISGVRSDLGVKVYGGLGQIGQACQFTEVQRLLCALVVTARLHHVEQTQQFQFFCLQQHAGRPAGFQLGPCLGTHAQKGLRNTNALCGAQVPRIGPSHGLHGFLSRQTQSHLPLRHGEFGLAHAAHLRIAAPEQRPAHTKLDVEALVVAAEGVGHGFARGADTGATKNPCSLAGAGRAVAVRCHVLFSLGQLDRRGCHKRQVFQFGQGGAGIG